MLHHDSGAVGWAVSTHTAERLVDPVSQSLHHQM
jgi:hypothetical protein